MSILFFILASICNSVMDKTLFHYHKSIFKKLNPKFWNGEISWKNKYKNFDPSQGRRSLPVQLTDSFHLFKSLMIIFITISIVTYSTITNPIIDIIIYGTAWNITFSLFFKHLLHEKI